MKARMYILPMLLLLLSGAATAATPVTGHGRQAGEQLTIPAVTAAAPQPSGTPVASSTAPATAIATATAIPQGQQTDGHYCTGLFGWCPDLGGLVGAAAGAVFNGLAHLFGDAFAGVTAPFQRALTYTPDVLGGGQWAGIRQLQGRIQQLCGVLFVGFLTVGLLASYLSSIGAGNFGDLISPVRRAVLVTGFIAGYQQFMEWGFQLLNGVTAYIDGAPVGATESGFAAVAHAFGTLSNLTSPVGIIDAIVIVVGLLITLLCVIIRMAGLGVLAAFYVVGPLALVTWLSPQFEFIARWWFRTFLSVALWPLGYAVALKIIANLLADGGAVNIFGGLVTSLGALGLLVMLYRVPAIVGSMVGAGAGLVGSAASMLVDAGIGAGVSIATRGAGAKLFNP